MPDWTTEQLSALEGATIVVTGANSGVGFEATRALARHGADVVLACRSVERGARAADEIRAEIEADGGEQRATAPGTLDVRECDLASLDSIRSAAEGIRADYDAVEVLCNNAGVMAIPRCETEDGFETQLGVNHLGHFALTGSLFDLLRASDGEARVVTQSSGAHQTGAMDFDDLHWEDAYGKWRAYGRSKLANLLFAYELQRRLDEHGVASVRSVACHPGWADTNLQRRTGEESRLPFAGTLMGLANRLFGQSAERGALPMLYAATADVEGGAYVGPSGLLQMRGAPEVQSSNAASHDREDARRLWEHSREATGVTFPFE